MSDFIDFKETEEQAAAIWDANLHSLAAQYLTDFDYPSDGAKAEAIASLKTAIENAADAWIKANCAF